MVIYLDVNEDGTLAGWGSTPSEDSVEIEIPEDHPILSGVGNYKYIDGELVKLTKEIYLDINEDGIIEGWSSTYSEGFIKIEVEEEHPVLLEFGKYKYINGELIRMPQEEIDKIYNVPEPLTAEERINRLENVILQLMTKG